MLPALLGSLLFCGFAALLVWARDRADRPIRDSEARFRDIAESASDWIWETDAALRPTYVSEQCLKSLDVAPAELIGHDLRTLFLPLPAGKHAASDIAALPAA